MDTDRSAVYAAELAAFDGTDLELVVGVEPLARRGSSLVARAPGDDCRSDRALILAVPRASVSSMSGHIRDVAQLG